MGGIEDVLGGVVYSADESSGTIQAGFGLVHSERLTVRLDELEGECTRAIIESRRGAAPVALGSSSYVEALAKYLEEAVL